MVKDVHSNRSPRIENRKARHEYTIEKTFECGMVLNGWEVSSLRMGRASISDSYVLIRNNEPIIIGMHITPMKNAYKGTVADSDSTRTRKILMNRDEIRKLVGLTSIKGYTLIPLNIHWKNGFAKVDVATAKGKKLYDKREAEKKKEWNRSKKEILY